MYESNVGQVVFFGQSPPGDFQGSRFFFSSCNDASQTSCSQKVIMEENLSEKDLWLGLEVAYIILTSVPLISVLVTTAV